jgi:zinc transport system permease protein
MVVLSIIGGIISVLLGLFGSLEFNTASGPTIIVAALILFVISMFVPSTDKKLQK